MNSSSSRPIIVIGMHRSGTSIVSELLEGMGCFIGWRKPVHHEPIYFIRLNDWLLQQSGASWDNPQAIHYLLENREVRPLVARYLALQLKAPRAVSFWGRHYLRYLTAGKCPGAWGWKDPRNTFTLPVWLDLFPEAKVIHVIRHGIDVAQSLVVRHGEIFAQKKALMDEHKALYTLYPKRTGFTDTLRGCTLQGGFTLWEEYFDQARQHVDMLGQRAIEIRYEDFLAKPRDGLNQLARFCEMDVTAEKLDELASALKPSRGLAYRKSEELRKAAEQFHASLAARGYSA